MIYLSRKIIIISVICLIVASSAAGFFGFRKWQKKQIAEKEKSIINVDLCIKAGYPLVKTGDLLSECRTPGGKAFELHEWVESPKPTDEEIIENYKNGEYGTVAEEKNPYNIPESIIILSSFLYKKSNEPVQLSYGCGRGLADCYIFHEFERVDDSGTHYPEVELLYRSDKDYPSGFSLNLFERSDEIERIPTIKFIDSENVIIKSEDGGGFLISFSFFNLNLKTKKISELSVFSVSESEGMPIASFSKNGRSIRFEDKTCFYPDINKSLETRCDNKIFLLSTEGIYGDSDYRETLIKGFDGDFKDAIMSIVNKRINNPPLPIREDKSIDFSFDLEKNIYNGNKFEFRIGQVNYRYDFDKNAVEDISFGKLFEIPEMKISFKYPLKYQEVSYSVNSAENARVLSGKSLYGIISEKRCAEPPCDRGAYITFGGIASDFSAPREGNYEDNFGYFKNGDAYFMRGLSSGEGYFISYPVKEISAINTKGIIIAGTDARPGPGAMSPNMRMAIFNLKNSEFSAITFVDYDINAISEKEFEEMLKTVELFFRAPLF